MSERLVISIWHIHLFTPRPPDSPSKRSIGGRMEQLYLPSVGITPKIWHVGKKEKIRLELKSAVENLRINSASAHFLFPF